MSDPNRPKNDGEEVVVHDRSNSMPNEENIEPIVNDVTRRLEEALEELYSDDEEEEAL